MGDAQIAGIIPYVAVRFEATGKVGHVFFTGGAGWTYCRCPHASSVHILGNR